MQLPLRTLIRLKRISERSLHIFGSAGDVKSFLDGKDCLPKRNANAILELVGLKNEKFKDDRVHIFHVNTLGADIDQIGFIGTFAPNIKCCRICCFGKDSDRVRVYAIQSDKFRGLIVSKRFLRAHKFSPEKLGGGAKWVRGQESNSTAMLEKDEFKLLLSSEVSIQQFDNVFVNQGIRWSDIETAAKNGGLTKREMKLLVERAVRLKNEGVQLLPILNSKGANPRLEGEQPVSKRIGHKARGKLKTDQKSTDDTASKVDRVQPLRMATNNATDTPKSVASAAANAAASVAGFPGVAAAV